MYYSVLAYEETDEDTHPEGAEHPPAAARAWGADHENRELLRMVAGQGEEAVAAFTLLYRRYQLPVFAFCTRVLGDRGRAEDMSQEVLYTVWRNAKTYRGQALVKTWVLGIAQNLCRNVWRKERRREECHLLLTLDPSQDVPSTTSTVCWAPFQGDSLGRCPDAATACEEQEQQHLLREGLRKLSPAQRTVLHFAYFEGLSIHEIAEVLGICAGTVKSRMANARRLLRHYLQHVGIR
jgi:RNA polymerase sigma-70 factor (ECF subfamily)